eukprot:TRINITY_DN3177_c0_g1_i1.p1 TRINITY_DN3177_c0_g1~~TRINITY_DN3177_c0_g1_i1.p1  ORF type:complete len:114 (-),score=7.33 TRINITY_DN3177_c0_g1_i1:127-468(-)
MSYICPNPKDYIGQYFGESHECVALVKYACKAPATVNWRPGVRVKGNTITYGTAIATFPDGTHYSGHAAIYLGQTSEGIQVVDQWVGQVAHTRTIRFGGSGISNDGNGFYVIR